MLKNCKISFKNRSLTFSTVKQCSLEFPLSLLLFHWRVPQHFLLRSGILSVLGVFLHLLNCIIEEFLSNLILEQSLCRSWGQHPGSVSPQVLGSTAVPSNSILISCQMREVAVFNLIIFSFSFFSHRIQFHFHINKRNNKNKVLFYHYLSQHQVKIGSTKIALQSLHYFSRFHSMNHQGQS